MKKLITIAIAALMALPVLAAEPREETIQFSDEILADLEANSASETQTADEESMQEGSGENELTARPPRPPRRPHPRRPRPPRTAWICLARDAFHNGYRYVDYDLAWARHGALRECHYRSPVGRCYLVTCGRY